MIERIQAPEGIEIDVNVYLTSVDGVDAVVAIKGLSHVPTFERAEAAILSAKMSLAPVSDADWRVMTRAEIAEYKTRNDPVIYDDEEDMQDEEWD